MYSVLLVDDCIADIDGLIKNINWASLDCQIVAIAKDGSEGIRKAQDYNPDIIITDVSMPNVDGMNMTKEIRRFMPNVVFIFMSCFDEFHYVKNAIEQNVSAYLLKPIKLTELEQAIQKAINALSKERQYNTFSRNINSFTENFLSDLCLGCNFDANHALLLGISYYDCFRMAIFKYNGIHDATKVYENLSKLKALCTSMSGDKTQGNYIIEYGINSLVCFIHETTMTLDQFVRFVEKVKEKAPFTKELLVSSQPEATKISEIGNVFHLLSNKLDAEFFVDKQNFELYKKINEVLMFGTEDNIKTLINELFPKALITNTNYLKSMSTQIINIANLILNENQASFNDIFVNEFLIWDKLFRIHDIINASQLLINLLVDVQRFLSKKRTHSDRYSSIAFDIKRYIDRNYPSPTIVDDVARHVHLSINHANSIFKKITGNTLFNYTISQRIEQAKILMHDNSLSVSDIAMAVGYVNNAHFSTAFKKHTGMSPTKYRNTL